MCSYLALGLALYLLYRVRMLTSVLALVRSAAAVGFSTVFPKSLSFGSDKDVRVPILNSNQSDSQSFLLLDKSTVFNLVVILLLLVLLITVLLFWLYLQYVKTNRLYLTNEIGNKDISVRIRYLQLYSAVYMYHFKAAAEIESIKVTTLWPKLFIVWPALDIAHVLQDSMMHLPEYVMLSPWSVYRLRHILESKFFYAVSLLEYNGNFRILNFEEEPNFMSHAIFRGQNHGRHGTVHFDVSAPVTHLHFYPSVTDLSDLRAEVE